jgi:chloramphenicol-sensitive protein RarD
VTDAETPNETAGIAYAGLAYVLWGFVPVYWRLLDDVPPFALTTHRVLWCAVCMAGVAAWRGRLRHVIAILATPRLLGTLALTSLLITINWSLFIYCVATNQLVEASFGYYLTPLLSMALGVIFFRERMSRVRMVGVAAAAAAVALQAIAVGHIPLLGLALAFSFGFYGYFRKKAPVDSSDGLLIETALMFPFALGLVLYWSQTVPDAFPSGGLLRNTLLVCGGPITAVPLALFTAGATRIRLTTLGFLQYLSPSITLVLATLAYHESFTHADAASFVLVWAALMIVAFEGWIRSGPAAQEGG